ncbi:hypothetical protein SH2C18_41700 [Clostridium sediminicola]|uniref:hypothetical protein n=1 Tax=Clostridium sediminicola TaxID=3114879 RepID=UPI0031F25397
MLDSKYFPYGDYYFDDGTKTLIHIHGERIEYPSNKVILNPGDIAEYLYYI